MTGRGFFPPELKIREMTPVGCGSVVGVETGVAGMDLLDVKRPPVPATAADNLSVPAVTPFVVN